MMLRAGMGDICSAWVTGRSGGPESTASLDLPDTSHSHQAGSSHPSTPLQQSLLQGTRREVAQRWACTARSYEYGVCVSFGGVGMRQVGMFTAYSTVLSTADMRHISTRRKLLPHGGCPDWTRA
jgi:hypothetical protein